MPGNKENIFIKDVISKEKEKSLLVFVLSRHFNFPIIVGIPIFESYCRFGNSHE